MRRTAVVLALLAALAWQSFAALASTVVTGTRADVVHGVMHWQEIPHHHGHHHEPGAAHDHDDAPPPSGGGGHGHGEAPPSHHQDDGRGVHVDASDESQDHLAMGHGCPPALVSDILTLARVPGGVLPGLAPDRGERPHFPDGLFRPPRSPA